jgi:predicted deacylase
MAEPAPSPAPEFEVALDPPDIGPWLAGNTGIAGVTTFESGSAGPHVALMALMHGNEYSGAVALDRLLRSGLRPARGRLSFAFANVEAFARFDRQRPTASRFVDEDMNRVWDAATLDGPRQSAELARARELRPWVETVDVLLDLHSMLWPSDAVVLCGETGKGARMGLSLGAPSTVVADGGHANGRRLIDYKRFSDPATPFAANLVEAGQHWDARTVDVALASIAGLAHATGFAEMPSPGTRPRRFARVTAAVTAATQNFRFVRAFRGGDVVAERNTLIALDGEAEIRTPHDDCMLLLPSLRPGRGHTAVRLARFEDVP